MYYQSSLFYQNCQMRKLVYKEIDCDELWVGIEWRWEYLEKIFKSLYL